MLLPGRAFAMGQQPWTPPPPTTTTASPPRAFARAASPHRLLGRVGRPPNDPAGQSHTGCYGDRDRIISTSFEKARPGVEPGRRPCVCLASDTQRLVAALAGEKERPRGASLDGVVRCRFPKSAARFHVRSLCFFLAPCTSPLAPRKSPPTAATPASSLGPGHLIPRR